MAKRIADNPAVVARKTLEETTEITLDGGHKIRVSPLKEYDLMLQRAVSQIKDPPIPVVWDEEKEREEPNPNDPEYVSAMMQADQERGLAILDAMMLFGVELVDGVPKDQKWRKRLKLAGIEVDWNDSTEVEFAYLKYVVFAGSDNLTRVSSLLNLSPGDLTDASAVFPGDTARDSD